MPKIIAFGAGKYSILAKNLMPGDILSFPELAKRYIKTARHRQRPSEYVRDCGVKVSLRRWEPIPK